MSQSRDDTRVERTESISPHPTPRAPHREDLELVARILAGDAAAWHRFVVRYAGLVYTAIRRTLRSRDADEVRSVMVDVLGSLYRGKLRSYEGRAALSTWLVVVTRSESLDHLRRRFGRDHGSRALAALTSEQRTVFRMYFIEARSPREVLDELERGGERRNLEGLLATLDEIEARLGQQRLRRLAYDLHAHAVGALSGRMLEYVDHVRGDLEERSEAGSPEYLLMEREARRTAELLSAALHELEPGERRLLQLRFEQRRTAREIAREMDLAGSRGVYSTIDRIVRKLRRLLEPNSDMP